MNGQVKIKDKDHLMSKAVVRRENMNEIELLKEFLDFPISTTTEVFNKFRQIKDSIFRENNSTGKERFLYVEGKRKNKVLLVAHADTYYDIHHIDEKRKHKVHYNNGVFTAVDENDYPQLLGADDRAGLAMLWLLKDSGHSLLVTDGEERGRKGSKWLMNKNRDIAKKINNHQFMIQLDREGAKNYKCYNKGTSRFKKYIEDKTVDINKNTYKNEDDGNAYTDICTLCERICGVNFSIGYHDKHSINERLVITEWLETYNMLKKLLEEDLEEFLIDD